ncbi:MAG: FG-GAP repeat protein [Planctomycetes bacterium]|nr:FG-GAP repeat protein [Planctomycetota bacterium]
MTWLALASRSVSTCLLAVSASAQIPSVGLATGDVDRDGFDDVAITSRHTGSTARGGMLHVVSGRTGGRLWSREYVSEGPPRILGVTIVAVGVAEPLVVAAMRDETTRELRLDLHRGSDGDPLLTHRLCPTASEYECFLAPMEDVDGDGVVELAIARPCFSRVGQFEGRISVVSLRDGCELAAIEGGRDRRQLGRQLTVGEFDREPGLDIAITAYAGPGPRLSSLDYSVVWLSGRTLSPFFERYSEGCGTAIGTSLATCGDVDGDGLDEIAIGALRTLDSDQGVFIAEARIVRAAPGDPLRTFAVQNAYDDGPFVVALRGSEPSARLTALGTPRADWSSGAWRVFDGQSRVVGSHVDQTRDWYPIELLAVESDRDPASRLVVVGARLEDDVHHYLIDLECWGGPGWQTRSWSYELEPRAARAR